MFASFADVVSRVSGRSVAIVGGGPSSLTNEPGFVDSHDLVVRVNNYKTGEAQGRRCDIFYSFFGGSIKKSVNDLKRDGVTFCMSKVPDSKPLRSEWHETRGKTLGIDFRYIYKARKDWWFCDVFVPSDEWFLEGFNALDRHIPTTGFSAIRDIMAAGPSSLYVTGFDFFSSGIHNTNEPWRKGAQDDPIGHSPAHEISYLRKAFSGHNVMMDACLGRLLDERG